LIFTNKRIFHILTKQDYSYRNSIAQLWYNDCKSIFTKGRNLVIEYKNGSREKFLYLSGKEKKKSRQSSQAFRLRDNPAGIRGGSTFALAADTILRWTDMFVRTAASI